MNIRLFTGMALGAILASTVADAAIIRYRQSGNWTETAPLDTGPGWQNVSAVPGVGDLGRLNWGNNTVTVTTVEQIGQLQIAVDEPGNLVVANGGSLSTINGSGENGRLIVGNNDTEQLLGTLLVQAGGVVNTDGILWTGLGTPGLTTIEGTANVGEHLWTGWNDGVTGTIEVNSGGILNVAGQLGLNWQNNGAIGLLSINDGGMVNLTQIHSSGNSIQGSSLLTIGGTGVLTKTSNFVNVIQTQYIDTGKIVGEGGATLDVSYDSNADLTTVSIIPEPSTLGLLGACGALAFLRRRRS